MGVTHDADAEWRRCPDPMLTPRRPTPAQADPLRWAGGPPRARPSTECVAGITLTLFGTVGVLVGGALLAEWEAEGEPPPRPRMAPGPTGEAFLVSGLVMLAIGLPLYLTQGTRPEVTPSLDPDGAREQVRVRWTLRGLVF
jgi:hypothetical protein